ncbi:S9 family peptidase [Paractinoplanes rishiriensis]|uniref:Acyl-peptide hydrolase n=1 Tax=Paractinoplanes rishiriensis TaxID=1050105 RepID=A0A919JTP3_9ACTN|nr:S9 family peptidase [Actinoplanes rishiriensis]GIE93124.1 peptidase S9 [Actinoplanes rishiriensis]
MTGQLHRVDATVLPLSWTNLRPPAEAVGSWSPSLSPDGRHCAYVSDRGGRPQVWVQPVGSDLAFLVDTGEEPVAEVHWSTGGGWLACLVAPGGAPRHEVWLIRPDGSDLHQVAGFGADTADNMRWLPGRSLLALTENLSTALLIDPATGERTVVATGDLISLLDVHRDSALLRIGPRGARIIVLRDGTVVTPGEQAVFAPDGAILARSENGEFPCLFRVANGATEVLAGGDAEIESFALTADGRRAAVLWNVRGGESEVELIDLTGGERGVLAPLPGSVVSGLVWSFDGSTLAFSAEGPGRPHGVWVWSGAAPALTSGAAPAAGPIGAALAAGPIGAAPAAGEIRAVSAVPAAIGAVRPMLCRFEAHDGLVLTGWLFRPASPGPHPTVLWLHGGPEAQERPGHSPLFQSLVDRGVAVFAPNVRGSAGFGRSFVRADNGPLRYAAIEDVRSAVTHLVATGVADPARVGCMGRSYGGYLTLAALTRFPDLFAVGIDICGMSNFATFYENTEPWIAAAAISKYGDPATDADLLADLSPLTQIDRLRAPLLIIHGENDSNVPVVEADQVAAALAARGIPHKYVLYPGEGHELLHRNARADFLREAVAWLTTHLR